MGQALNFKRSKHLMLEKIDESKAKIIGGVTCDRFGSQSGVISGVRYKRG